MQPIIEVSHLVKRYKRSSVNAVNDISFTVAPGELFALLGPNGAGKTTTISILTTTLSPTSGTVRIAGHDVNREASVVRRAVGIIFQQPSLDLNLTAEENVRFHAILYGLYPFRPVYALMPRAYRNQVTELAAVLGIEKEIFKPIKTFSGGMKRKLEIIRSLVHKPHVLFLDEPTSGLDPVSRRNLWEYLRQVRRESGTTVFLTTHYLEESEEADTVCIINKGQIVSYGAPSAIKADLIQNYLEVDAQDREQLRAELRRLGYQFSDTTPLRIVLDGQSAQQVVKSIETPLTLLKTHIPTLEDAYLAIVEEKDRDHE
ncbi:MAG: ABC transporter ATP-binding protein [Anaerolineae bacterium]